MRRVTAMNYEHTQKSPLHFLLYGVALTMAGAALFIIAPQEMTAAFVLLFCAFLVLISALSFGYLRVVDHGDRLTIRYGPLPLFRKSFPYAAMTAVEPGRSSIIDGWGIHYVPFRGWTYNLWGFDCVKITMGQKLVRIGSDDVENLTAFLRGKIRKGPEG